MPAGDSGLVTVAARIVGGLTATRNKQPLRKNPVTRCEPVTV